MVTCKDGWLGTSLQTSLQSVLTSLENISDNDEEELLFQCHRIDELLIILHNLSTNIDLEIATEDVSTLSNFIVIFNDLRKLLTSTYRRKKVNSTKCCVTFTNLTSNGKPGRPKFTIQNYWKS